MQLPRSDQSVALVSSALQARGDSRETDLHGALWRTQINAETNRARDRALDNLVRNIQTPISFCRKKLMNPLRLKQRFIR